MKKKKITILCQVSTSPSTPMILVTTATTAALLATITKGVVQKQTVLLGGKIRCWSLLISTLQNNKSVAKRTEFAHSFFILN
jgi:hypothetical protein